MNLSIPPNDQFTKTFVGKSIYMSRVGFYKTKSKEKIYPDNPDDVTSSWELKLTSFIDEKLIEIDGSFILSSCAPVPATTLLMSTTERLPYKKTFEICNILTYVTDSPVHLRYGDIPDVKPLFKGIKPYLRLMGFRNSMNGYELQVALNERYEAISETAEDRFIRVLPFDCSYTDFSCALDIPNDKKLMRAFYVYRQGVFSVDPQGAILNYWRAFEAITNDKNHRNDIFDSFEKYRLKPVYCKKYSKEGLSKSKFNLMLRYRNYLSDYVNELQKKYESRSIILDHLYKNRRCPSAHANTNILEIRDNVSLVTLYNDALLIKYLSRCGIEKHWKDL